MAERKGSEFSRPGVASKKYVPRCTATGGANLFPIRLITPTLRVVALEKRLV